MRGVAGLDVVGGGGADWVVGVPYDPGCTQ